MFKLLKISASASLIILAFLNSVKAEGFTERSECPVLYDLGKWEHHYITGGGEYWGRNQNWFESNGWITATGDGIDLDEKSKSYTIIKDPHNSSVLIYIGPWKRVKLVRRNGFLAYLAYENADWRKGVFNTNQEEVEIRLIATQKGSMIRSHYETKDDLNKNITEQRLVLLEPSDDLIELCKVKWVSKFGYNAVADYKLNPFRFFTGKVLTGSGKILDSETGELIADEKGNLVNQK